MRATPLLLLAAASLGLGACTMGGPAQPAAPIARPYVAGHVGQNGFWVPGHYRDLPQPPPG